MEIPAFARWLGYGGLLPFLASALGAWALEGTAAALALRSLLAYGAVILSFVGAVHWGLALARPGDRPLFHLGWGVTPSLVAWVALLLGGTAGLLLMAACFAAAWAVDRGALAHGELPAWYGRLRTHLTVGAALSLLAGAPLA